jgi:membrane protease YdiL (CAAX protease family)
MPENEVFETAPQETGADITVCWRCELEVAAEASVCPHCSARQTTTGPAAAAATAASRVFENVNLLFCTFTLLLVTGIVHALVLAARFDRDAGFNAQQRREVFTQILVVEGVDTVIIAVALAMSWGQYPRTLPRERVRLVAWLTSLPILAGLIVVNLAYHWLIRELVQVPLVSDELMKQFDSLAFIAVCLQPAVVEEAYCRWFALDTLRATTGMHAAVWISATMFGLMHVAVLPSIPYLIFVGAVFAYLRLASGSLLLPIVLHFAHNTVVLLLESAGQ